LLKRDLLKDNLLFAVGEEAEYFGKAKFGASWVPPLTKVEHELLSYIRDDWYDPDGNPTQPIFQGPDEAKTAAWEMFERARQRVSQVLYVKKGLLLLKRFGRDHKPFEPVAGDDRAILHQFRRLNRRVDEEEGGTHKYLTDILDWLGDRGALSAGREHLPWDEVTARIDEAWLRRKHFGPPSVETRVPRGAIVSADFWDKPSPSRRDPVSPSPPSDLDDIHDGEKLGDAWLRLVLKHPDAQALGARLSPFCTVSVFGGGYMELRGESYRLYDQWRVILNHGALFGVHQHHFQNHLREPVQVQGPYGYSMAWGPPNPEKLRAAFLAASSAVKLLVARNKLFYDQLRGQKPKWLAQGTTPAGSLALIDSAQWDRPDLWLDPRHSNIWDSDDAGPGRIWWNGVTLRLAPADAVRPPDSGLIPSPPVANSNATLIGGFSPSTPGNEPVKPVAPAPTKPPRGKAGRRETWKWPDLEEPLRRHVEAMSRKGERFESKADLVNWCREHVRLRPKQRLPKGADGKPDPKTTKSAIVKYGFDKIAGFDVED
jgi:hypothetical protein